MLTKGLAVLAMVAILATPALAFGQGTEKKEEHPAVNLPGMTGSSNQLGFALAIGLGEPFTWVQAVGGALVISGVLLVSLRRS